MSKGWVKLHRSIAGHFLWQEKPFTRGQAFVDLILRASHRDAKVLFGTGPKRVARGEFITSIAKLSGAYGWSQGKVKRFLEMLQIEEAIRFKTERHYTHILIENYSEYQDGEVEDGEQTESERGTNGDQTETRRRQSRINKELKKNEKKKEKRVRAVLPPPPDNWNDVSKAAYEDWKTHKKQIGNKLTALAAKRLINKYKDKPEQFSTDVEYSILMGWKGVYPPPKHKANGTNGQPIAPVEEVLKQYFANKGEP